MKYLRILYVQVLIAIALGVLAGWRYPGFAPAAKIISDTFINMIRMLVPFIIFCSIVAGIAGAGSMKKVGRIGLKAFIYFEVMSTLALLIGLMVANLLKPGHGVAHPATVSTQVTDISRQASEFNWGSFISHIVPASATDAFAKGDILQVLFFSILFAVALKYSGEAGRPVHQLIESFGKVLYRMMGFIMRLSPVGAFGGMAYTIGQFGFKTLLVLGKLMVCFYLTGFLFLFIVLNAVMRYYKLSFRKMLLYLKEEILIVLGASSSEAVLPSVMHKLQLAGVEREVVALLIPTGYSFNLDGTTIYLSMSVIFLAQVFGIDLSIGQQLLIIGILIITSKGAAGVTGSGFIVLASTLSVLKVIPLEGLALLIGVDRFMSEGRALVNFIGNSVAAIVIAKSEDEIDEPLYRKCTNDT